MCHERWKQSRRGANAPVDLAREQKRQEGHRSQIPPNHSKQPSPHYAEAETRRLPSKEQAKGHTDYRAHQNVKKQGANKGKRSVEAGDLGQNTRGDHHRTRYDSAHETCECSPTERTQYEKAWAFGFPIQGIRFDEQLYPQPVDRSVGDAQNQPVKDVPHERAEKLTAPIRRPVQRQPGGEWKKCERAQEPAEDRKPETPAHG